MKNKLAYLTAIAIISASCGKSNSKNEQPKPEVTPDADILPQITEEDNIVPDIARSSEAQLLFDKRVLPENFRGGSVAAFDVQNFDYSSESLTAVYASFSSENGTSITTICDFEDCGGRKSFEVYESNSERSLRIVLSIKDRQPTGTYKLGALSLYFKDGSKKFFWPGDNRKLNLMDTSTSEYKVIETTDLSVSSLKILNDNGDEKAPAIVDFYSDKSVYKKGETIRFTLKLSEPDETGIGWGAINFRKHDDYQIAFGKQNHSYVADNEILYEILVPQDANSGTYILNQLTITDGVGNTYEGDKKAPEIFSELEITVEE